ncbi:hypothetical protein EJ04DRAFT_572357 [Polyplosphaeria fusca]|uniref:Uncharacterized protein n=1 Tax=Polyplosphaeria fusca TaxID=682080 RepID=A0A9P4R9G6_9PLEO|nr:hypothetical protein EJ04DRAFT_572357 [Polyplosphaeria fusca]
MRSQLFTLFCPLLAAFFFLRVDASCFYPDGEFPTDYIYAACSNDEGASCCRLSEGDQCLSNGLCYNSWLDSMFRGGCSDQSWNSPNCFQHCKTGDDTSSYDELVSCGGNRYCCSSDSSTCCNDDSKVFTVDTGTVIKDFASTASYTLPIETPTDAPAGTQTGDTGSVATTTANGSERPKATSSGATNSAAAATSTSGPSASETSTHGISKAALIAIAVAGVVVLIASIFLVWFFMRRSYRKKLAAGSNNQSFPMSSDGFQKLPDKSPRPVEVPVPMHPPAPPYQPPAYTPPPQHNAVELPQTWATPQQNHYGQPIYEAPGQPYGRF